MFSLNLLSSKAANVITSIPFFSASTIKFPGFNVAITGIYPFRFRIIAMFKRTFGAPVKFIRCEINKTLFAFSNFSKICVDA